MDLAAEAARGGMPLRILVTRLRYLGDVVLTIPVLTALKKHLPEAEVYYLAEAPYASVLEGHPALDGVIALTPGLAGTARTVARLRRLRLTAAIDLFYNPRSALLVYLSGAPVRIGGSRRWRRRLYTDVYTVPPGIRSAIRHHLYPLSILGIDAGEELPRLHLSRREIVEGAGLLSRIAGGADVPVIALHPGGTWPTKRWPPERYAALADAITGRLGARVLVITGPGEEEIGRAVAGGAGSTVYELPLQGVRRLAAVLAACEAVVANDGGVMHLAAGLGVPTVGVFGPTEPDIWFPYEGRGPFALATRNEDCAPCHRHFCDDPRCLNLIGPYHVLSKLEEVLSWQG